MVGCVGDGRIRATVCEPTVSETANHGRNGDDDSLLKVGVHRAVGRDGFRIAGGRWHGKYPLVLRLFCSGRRSCECVDRSNRKRGEGGSSKLGLERSATALQMHRKIAEGSWSAGQQTRERKQSRLERRPNHVRAWWDFPRGRRVER